MTGTIKGTLQNPKSYSIKWEINRFFADCQNVGDYYESPKSPIRYANKITNWHLRVYPKNKEEKSKDYVCLFLYYETVDSIEVTVDFQLSIVNQKDKRWIKTVPGRTFKNLSSNWGYDDFIAHSVINDTKNNVLIDDTLTIMCEITFRSPGRNDIEKFDGYDEWINKIGHGIGNYEEILESGSFTDVTFNVQDKTIKSHKAILSCRSPVFKAMFEHDMMENKQNIVDITDMNYDIMKELFRFIYSEKVENIDKIASDLLIAADKYQVTELTALCEKTLYDKLTVGNAVEYLTLTNLCETIHLKRLVIKFVAARLKEIIEKPGFKDLDSNVMYEIMQAIVEKD